MADLFARSASPGEYAGVAAAQLAERLGVPFLLGQHETGSTLDDAHDLGERGAPHGTLVLAERQRAGRGRQGRAWTSAAGQGIWLTLLARDLAPDTVAVLAIRIGLAAAPVLDRFAPDRVRLKWPNDLHVRGRKLAGVLAEARWQAGVPSWVAVGMGVNVIAPSDVPEAGGLAEGTDRVAVLQELVPALTAALRRSGPLDEDERTRFAARDLAVGRAATSPLVGTVVGIAADGALRVLTVTGVASAYAGSLRFAAPAPTGESGSDPTSPRREAAPEP